MNLSGFYSELRRRKVIRVSVAYVVVAWLIVQIAETIFVPLQLPPWSLTFIIVVLGLGFPIAIVLAWAFEVTPEGIVRDSKVTDTSTDKTEPDEDPVPSIAVLPFEDMSAEKNQEYFCDGIADEILNVLTKVDPLRVASRTSSFQFKNTVMDIKDIGRQLNVKTVLEGSVRKQGNQIRVIAQLIDVQDGYHLWSERYHRDLEDIFLIQEEIANSIVSALKMKLSGQEQQVIRLRSTKNVDAYEYYLRGWQYFHKTTQKDLLYSIDMFEKALEEDAEFTRAWAGIADAYAFLYLYFDNQADYRDKASKYSKQALALCDDAAEAHVSRGMAHLLCQEYADAEDEFDHALKLAPNCYEAYYFYGRTCFHQGKFEKAAAMFEKASQVNPDEYQSLLLLPQTYRALGHEQQAIDAGARGIEAARNFLQLNPDDSRALYLGAGQLAEQGDINEGKEWIERALAINASDGIILYNAACFYSRIKEVETALQYLEKTVLSGMANEEWIAHDTDLDPLRSHPEFNALVAKVAPHD